MNKETLKQLLELSNYVNIQSDILEKVGVTVDPLDVVSDEIHEIIITAFEIPKDNTEELQNLEDINIFCRDCIYTDIFDCEKGHITLDKLIYKLENWEVEYK
jgi:hypothetical protein